MVYAIGNICKLLGSKESCGSRDGSVGRAEDCSINQNEILSFMVQIRPTRKAFMIYTMGKICKLLGKLMWDSS